jgi:hypothetical protein
MAKGSERKSFNNQAGTSCTDDGKEKCQIERKTQLYESQPENSPKHEYLTDGETQLLPPEGGRLHTGCKPAQGFIQC